MKAVSFLLTLNKVSFLIRTFSSVKDTLDEIVYFSKAILAEILFFFTFLFFIIFFDKLNSLYDHAIQLFRYCYLAPLKN